MEWRLALAEELAIVDEPTIMRLRALMADVAEDGEDLARDLLETFRVDVERRLAAFDEAIAREDSDEASEAVHALKGASATVGALRVSALCAVVEQALRDKRPIEGASEAIHEEATAALLSLSTSLRRRLDN